MNITIYAVLVFLMVFAMAHASQLSFASISKPYFTFSLGNYTTINGAIGGSVGISSTRLVVSPGTYAVINNKTYSSYNLSLILLTPFNVNVPPGNSTISGISDAIAIAVDGSTGSSVKFVSSSGSYQPIKLITGGQAITLSTWSWSGGVLQNLNYYGGSYVKPQKWLTYNSSYIYTNLTNATLQVLVIKNKGTPSTSLTTSIIPTTILQNSSHTTIPSTTVPTTVPPKPVTVQQNNEQTLYALIAAETAAIIILVILLLRKRNYRMEPSAGI